MALKVDTIIERLDDKFTAMHLTLRTECHKMVLMPLKVQEMMSLFRGGAMTSSSGKPVMIFYALPVQEKCSSMEVMDRHTEIDRSKFTHDR